MASAFTLVDPNYTTKIDEGTVRQAAWDKRAWTLLVDMRRSGQRLVQIPVYKQQPRPGDRIQLIGRQPLVGVKINGVDVFEAESS